MESGFQSSRNICQVGGRNKSKECQRLRNRNPSNSEGIFFRKFTGSVKITYKDSTTRILVIATFLHISNPDG